MILRPCTDPFRILDQKQEYFTPSDPPRVPHAHSFAIKFWAKRRSVNDPYRGSLSSYAWVLLAIHFLQTCEPPVLPCLQATNWYSTRCSPVTSIILHNHTSLIASPLTDAARPLLGG